MNKNKNALTKKKNINLCVIYSNAHQNVKKTANFTASLAKNYFETSTYEILPNVKKQYILTSMKILYHIIRRKVKILILVEPWYPILILLFLRGSKTKLIYRSGNINFDVFRSLKFNFLLTNILKLIEIQIIKRSDIIFSDAESMINYFSRYNKNRAIYYVPESIREKTSYYKGEIKSNTISGTDSISFLKVGYISTIHTESLGNRILPRGWELIEICKKLLEADIQEFEILIIGKGSGFYNLNAMVKERNFTKYFKFTGYVSDDDKIELLSHVDIGFCEDYKSYMTHRFNLSSKIQEYLNVGVPVVTGNQGDKRIVIGNSENPCGICIEALDDKNQDDFERYINDLSKAIIYLRNHATVLSKMKENCLSEFSRRFSRRSIELTIDKVFKELYHQEIEDAT